jgi:hypothetical protein
VRVKPFARIRALHGQTEEHDPQRSLLREAPAKLAESPDDRGQFADGKQPKSGWRRPRVRALAAFFASSLLKSAAARGRCFS